MFRRIAISVAFSTCFFLNTWAELAEGDAYLARYDPLYSVVIPVVCWQVLVAGAIFVALPFLRRRPTLMVLVFMSAAPAVGVAILRILPFSVQTIVHYPMFWPVTLAVAAVPAGVALRRPDTAARVLSETLLYAIPILVIVVLQAGRATFLKYPAATYADAPLAAPIRGTPPPVRFIWIVFDEMSQTTAFAQRPSSVKMPELDRFMGESFYAASAMGPSDATMKSLPALTLGQDVERADPVGPDGLLLTLPGRSDRVRWRSLPNVFDEVRGMGLNTAVVGWYHPYGRVLNPRLTRCYWTAPWHASAIEEPTEPRPLLYRMWFRARQQLSILPFWKRIQRIHPQRERAIERYSYLLDRTKEVVSDPSIGLTLLHLPVPHPPAIFDRAEGALSARRGTSYLDNLVLADRTFGEIRRALERSGLWDRTAVLVSADHGWRPDTWREMAEWTAEDEATATHNDTLGVPFLLRLPHQTSQLRYEKRFDTVITRKIIAQVLSGKITEPSAIAPAIESATPK